MDYGMLRLFTDSAAAADGQIIDVTELDLPDPGAESLRD